MIKVRITHTDSFMFEVIDNQHALRTFGKERIYILYDDDTESEIEQASDLERAIADNRVLGIEMGFLTKLTSIGSGKARHTFSSLYQGSTFFDITYDTPADYVTTLLNRCKDIKGTLYKNVFQLITATLFIRENTGIFIFNDKFTDIPSITIPILFRKPGMDIAILTACSKKALTRCDLEAAAIKYIRPATRVYIMYSGPESDILQTQFMAAERAVSVTTPEFNILCAQLKEQQYIVSTTDLTYRNSPYF